MNKIYRLVFNHSLGFFVPVAEFARACGKAGGGLLSSRILRRLALAGSLNAVIFAAPQVYADGIVPASGKTEVFNAPNNVPVINIETANGAGLSHNRYHHFNVDNRGVVLNNGDSTQIARQSQLAGQVMSNLNLVAGQQARTILNEVVSANRSTLAGYMEVLGGKADVIVANPYGITCNGCGFINTDRATLSTGTPIVNADGLLGGFRVNMGDILIQGNGLDGTKQNIIDLVARSVKLDGQVNGVDVKIVTGANEYSYADRSVSGSATASGTTPTYAIDSTAVGGMYAGRITLLATEAGVGVRMLGEAAASSDDFTLTSAGNIEIRSKVSAERDVALTYNGASSGGATAIHLNGTGAELSAERNVTLASQNTAGITLTDGKITAGQDLSLTAGSLTDSASASTTRFASRDTTVTTSGATSINGTTWGTGGKQTLMVASLSIGSDAATLYSGANSSATDRTLNITATSGDLSLANASLTSATALNLEATQGAVSLTGSGSVQAGAAMDISAATSITNAGNILGATSVVVDATDAQATLTNSGRIQADGALTLGQTSHVLDITNSGNVLGNTLAVRAAGITNTGNVQATNSTTVNATSLTNSGSSAKFLAATASGGSGSFTLSGALTNQGTLQSAGTLTATAGGALTNSGNLLALRTADGGSNGAMSVTALTVDNSGVIDGGGSVGLTVSSSATTGDTFVNSGSIQGGGATTLTVGNKLWNKSAGKVIGDAAVTVTSSNASFTLDNDGLLQSTGSMTLGQSGHTATIDNAAYNSSTGAGLIRADGSLSVAGGSITNAGTVQAASGSTVTGTTFTNSGASSKFLVSTASGSDGSMTFSGAVTNAGTLQSAGGLSVSASGDVTNSGTITATGTSDTLAISGATIVNNGSAYIEGGDVTTLTATNTSGGTFGNGGQIHSVDTLSIISGGEVSNSSNGKLLGDGAVSITSPQASFSLSNGGRIQSGGAMTLGGASHTVVIGQDFTGVMAAGSTLNVTGGNLTNYGKISAASGTTMNVAALTNGASGVSDALILGATGSGASTITASGALSNYGAIHSNDNLSVTAAGVTNRSTGGMSSLTTLNVTASGSNDINNYGAFYAGSALNLTATGDAIVNRSTGTIDSSGTFTSSSADFTNNNTVVTTGNITITTTNSFTNSTPVSGTAPSKTLGSVSNVRNQNRIGTLYEEDFFDEGADIYAWEDTFDRTETLNGTVPTTKAQIIANGGGSSITINYGNSGHNYLAVISAPTVNISGTGTFTNEDLTLYKYTYTRRWISVHDDWLTGSEDVYWARTDANRSGWDAADENGNGDEYDDFSPGSGWSGSYGSEATAKSQALNGAAMSGAVVVQTYGAGIFATNFNFSGGTLSNVGSPWPSDSSQAKAGSATTGSVSSQSASAPSAGSATSVSSASSASAGSKTSVVAGSTLSFAGLNLTLPSNPNGYFVVAVNPSADYLVETNPMFAVGTDFVGSNYLAQRYGYNPDTTQKRLGDASYEAFLIRQQLIQQTGSNVLKGYGTEAAQMQQLMDQAVAQGKELGLQFGKALTPSQIANLKQDIVWMEEVVVAGQKVLAPRVYLASATRDMIASGATISAENVNIAGKGLNNTGGTIEGSKTLTVKTTGDITNTSGKIKGGDVSLTSTQGSVVNKTYSEGHGDEKTYNTLIGKTAGIEATGSLNVDAKKDITNLGADMKAGKDASLKAGGNVTFDTIVDKTTTSSSTSSNGFFTSNTTSTTNTTEKNIGSNLQVGGNLNVKSGGDTTIAGSNAKVGGSLDVDAGGSFKVEARQDKSTTNTVSETSGLGVGGGLAGTQKTTTDEFKGTNVGSTLSVGGNANVKAGNEMVLQGSDMSIGGNASINATNGVKVLDGLDEERKTTKTETTTFLKMGGSTNAEAQASAGTKGTGPVNKGASASASAKASADGDFKLVETETSVTNSGSNKSVASNLKVGGNLDVKTQGTVTIQGSNVDVGGNASLDAKNVEVLTGRNESWSNTDTTRTSVGIYGESGANAQANAGYDPQRGAGAGASADAKATATIGARTEHETSSDYSLKNSSSTIKVGGNLDVKAKENAKFVGANVESGGDMKIEAKNITNLSAQDVTTSSSSREAHTAGIYLEAGAEAHATTANGGDAGAKVEASAGLRYKNEQESSKEGSVTHVTNTFKSGGNLTRNAKDTITDQGTQLEAGGNINQSAREIKDIKAENSQYSSRDSQVHDAKIGVYAGASAEAGTQTTPDADASAGFKASYEGKIRGESESSTQAVTTKYKAGGSINSTSTEKTTLIGTQFEAGKDVNINAGSVDYQAARDTHQSSSSNNEINVEMKAAVYGKPGASLDAGFSHGSGSESSSTAKTGSINAGGNVNINTKGNATFEGTNIEAGNQANISAGGGVDFKAARDTHESSSTTVDANLSLSAEKGGKGGGGGKKAGAIGASAGHDTSSSDQAVTGSIKSGKGGTNISAGKDVRLEGTDMQSGGDTSLKAGGDVKLEAAKSTSTGTSVGGGFSVKGKSGDSSSKGSTGLAGANLAHGKEVTSKGTSIQSDGKVKIEGKNVVNQEAKVNAKGGKQVKGNEVKKKAENSTTSVGVAVGAPTTNAGTGNLAKPGSKQ